MLRVLSASVMCIPTETAGLSRLTRGLGTVGRMRLHRKGVAFSSWLGMPRHMKTVCATREALRVRTSVARGRMPMDVMPPASHIRLSWWPNGRSGDPENRPG